MNDAEREGQATVGLDVGDRQIHACFLDYHGAIVEESRLATKQEAIRRRFSGTGSYRIVQEAGLAPAVSPVIADVVEGAEQHPGVDPQPLA